MGRIPRRLDDRFAQATADRGAKENIENEIIDAGGLWPIRPVPIGIPLYRPTERDKSTCR